MLEVHALAQPDRAGMHALNRLARGLPERHGHVAGHVAAEAVDDCGPLTQRRNLVLPQRGYVIVEINHIRPLADLVATPAAGLLVEEFRVFGHKCRVGRGVVIHHVDDALHAARVDFIHQMFEILHRAVFGVHGAVVAVCIGAAEAALFILHADGVDGHEPDDIHAQRADAVEIGLDGAEGALTCVVTDVDFINDALTQRKIGMFSHGCCSFSENRFHRMHAEKGRMAGSSAEIIIGKKGRMSTPPEKFPCKTGLQGKKQLAGCACFSAA